MVSSSRAPSPVLSRVAGGLCARLPARVAAVLLTVLAVLLGGPAIAVPAPGSGSGPLVNRQGNDSGRGPGQGPVRGPDHRPQQGSGGGPGLSADGPATVGVLVQRPHAAGAVTGWSGHHTTHPGPGPASASAGTRIPGSALRTGSAPFASDTPRRAEHHGTDPGRAPPRRQGT